MATYAVGDVQGCHEALQCVLKKARFGRSDRLWLVGDLVGRGPDSLSVLRYVRKLDGRATVVLGNHDLNLLAVRAGLREAKKKDRLEPLLAASDCDQLLDWLRRQPLLHIDKQFATCMVHAGIPPQWSLEQAQEHAREVELVLGSKHYQDFLSEMYGNQPATWNEQLQGMERLRVITNYLTRMRICSRDGTLDLDYKSGGENMPEGFYPWFDVPMRRTAGQRILFGHWATLMGNSPRKDVVALDTGCVWGESMRLLRLDDNTLFHCDCAQFL